MKTYVDFKRLSNRLVAKDEPTTPFYTKHQTIYKEREDSDLVKYGKKVCVVTDSIGSLAEKTLREKRKSPFIRLWDSFYFNDVENSTLSSIPSANIPVFWYGGGENKQERNKWYELMDEKNIYNKRDEIKKTASKTKTHEIFGNRDWLPKVAFSIDDVDQVGFPLVAKINNGHSGVGIKKVDSIQDLENISGSGFSLFEEFLDFKKEYRAFMFKDRMIGIDERIVEEDTWIDKKKENDEIKFIYKPVSTRSEFDSLTLDKLDSISREIRTEINLDIWAIDFVITKNNELKVLELNSGIGMGDRRQLLYYIAIYEDFYKKSIPADVKARLFRRFSSDK